MNVLFDLSDSCHSRQQSGIPRLARNLYAAFPGEKDIVVYDRYWRRWRRADNRERRWADPAHHVPEASVPLRGWSDWQKARGRIGNRFPFRGGGPFSEGTALVVPELYFPSEGRNFAALRGRCGGPLVAIFHDAVALRYPQWSSRDIAENFSAYAEDLVHFDGVAAVSASSARELEEFWAARGWRETPPVAVIPPGSDGMPGPAMDDGERNDPPMVLMVSTVEPRKNHLGVLAAANRLWREGRRFRIVFAGGCVPEMRTEWESALRASEAPEGACRYIGRVARDELEQLYRECLFTVYPSLWEGFGLPVMESLRHGKPCLCSDRGGLAERVAGGGCLIVDPESTEDLARGLRRLLEQGGLRARLRTEARSRRYRGWSEYAADLREWIEELLARGVRVARISGGVAALQSEESARERFAVEGKALRGQVGRIRRAYMRFAREPKLPDPVPPFAEHESCFSETPEQFPEIALEGVDVLSMDIFDTCLQRIVPLPSSVFRMAAREAGDHGPEAERFAEIRRSTEEKLRRAAQEEGRAEDVDLAEIYRDLARQHGWSGEEEERRCQREIQLEKRLVRARPEALRLVRSASERGCRVVYTSEMYLPESVLAEMLEEVGFPVRPGSVYASGSRGLSKGSGRLYAFLKEQYPRQKFLHVGDNPASDEAAAAAAGIKPVLVTPPGRVLNEELAGLLRILSHESAAEGGFWERCGARVLGPVVAAWALWLERRVREKGLRQLYFLTRDGYFPSIGWERLGCARRTGVPGQSLFASRRLYRLAAMDKVEKDDWEFLLKPAPRLSGLEFLTRAGIPPETARRACRDEGLEPDAPLCHHRGFYDPHSRDRLYHAFTRVMDSFYPYRDGLRERVLSYLAEEGLHPGEAAGIVDVGWNGSSFGDLRRLLAGAAPAAGLYFGLWQEAKPLQDAGSFFMDGEMAGQEENLLRGGVGLMEFLLGSPRGSVVDLRRGRTGWNPVYLQPDIVGPRERTAYAGLERGLSRFLDAFVAAGGASAGGHGKAFLRGHLCRLIFHPTQEELRELGSMTHAEGWGSARRLRLLPQSGRLSGQGERVAAFAYAGWKAPLRRSAEFDLFREVSGP